MGFLTIGVPPPLLSAVCCVLCGALDITYRVVDLLGASRASQQVRVSSSALRETQLDLNPATFSQIIQYLLLI